MTTTLIFCLKLFMAGIVVLATIITTIVLTPVLLIGWLADSPRRTWR